MSEHRIGRSLEEQLYAALDDTHWTPSEDRESTDDPAAANTTADVVAAAVGYAGQATLTRVANDTTRREALRRLWRIDPPTATLVTRAWRNEGLLQLLTDLHLNDDTAAAAANRVVLANLRNDEAAGPQQDARTGTSGLGSRGRRGFALAAADDEQRYTQTWAGGRLIRQRLSDGTTTISLDYTRPGGAGRIIRLTTPEDAARPFRLLLALAAADPDNPGGDSVAQGVVLNDAALDAFEDPGDPVDPVDLVDEDLARVADSVAAARGVSETAWRQAAHNAGKDSDLYQAVLRGSRRRRR